VEMKERNKEREVKRGQARGREVDRFKNKT
jgi:hypothetical protein